MVEVKKVSVAEQLAQYRKKKKKEEDYAALKQKMWRYLGGLVTFWRAAESGSGVAATSPGSPEGGKQEEESRPVFQHTEIRRRNVIVREDTTTEEEPPPTHYTRLEWAMLTLKILMWLLLQKVFILLEFGAVFFILSAFLFIWYNLRNEPKKKGEVSAYSVFNPNCEVIDGTFTAEQFERELLHKM